jgi:starvation-inducible DNA-binding protein
MPEIRKDDSQSLAVALATVLADATVMYHRVHGFHWNIVGTDFPQYHAKFEEIYNDVWESLDGIGENLRKIGVFAPFRLADLAGIASVSDAPVADYGHATLVADLITTNAGVLASLNMAFQIANQTGKNGVANFLAGRIEMHDKWAWQLQASLNS